MKHNQQTVEQIDAGKEAYFTRHPDGPQGRVRPRSRKSAEILKAESRMRTAAWRADLDKRGRPESDTVALPTSGHTPSSTTPGFGRSSNVSYSSGLIVKIGRAQKMSGSSS